MREHEKGKKFDEFYTLHNHPVFMATLTKAGCTYLKNLFYFIDQNELHPLGDFIHQDESKMIRAEAIDIRNIEKSPYVFIVMRNPFDRFMSLYYEKIFGRGAGSMDWFRISVGQDIGMNFSDELPLANHQENALKLIGWLDKNLNNKTEVFKDFHWRRQSDKYNRIKGFEPKVLTLEGLNQQLPHLLSPVISDIQDKMDAVRARNHSPKPFSFDETLTDEIRDQVSEVYKKDLEIVSAAQRDWERILSHEK